MIHGLDIYVSELFDTDLMIYSDGKDYELRENNVIILVGSYEVVLAEFNRLSAELERKEDLYFFKHYN